MSVVVKRDAKKEHKIYHRQGCIQIKRIKQGTLLKVTVSQAEKKDTENVSVAVA